MRFSILLSVLFLTAQASADAMTPLEVYKRCYIRMVREVPNATEAIYRQVAMGELSADQGCLKIFDAAALNVSGVLPDKSNSVSQRVLKTFNDLHGSWFQSKVNSVTSPFTYLVHDLDEPALYFTRAAFLPKTSFSSVVTHNTGLSGLRQQRTTSPVPLMDAQVIAGYGGAMPYANDKNLRISYYRYAFNPTTKRFTTSPRPVPTPTVAESDNHRTGLVILPGDEMMQTGDLVGIRPAISVKIPYYTPIAGATGDLAVALDSIATNFDANKHFGGGVLGSQTFLMNNSAIMNQLADDYRIINRRLTSRMFEDLLCHQLPTLTTADVEGDVIPTSQYAYQTQSTCMRCHSSIDPLAMVLKNQFIFTTGNAANRQTVGHPLNSVIHLPSSPSATLFALKPPVGMLRYRELVTGVIRSGTVSKLSEVGAQMAAGNDLYTCAAKRYYRFFTGVNVDLSAAATEPLDLQHQKFVLKLGQTLKTTQSVRSLLSEIFKSQTFKTRNYEAEMTK